MKKIKLHKINQNLYYYKSKYGLPIYMLKNNNVNEFYISLNVRYGSCHTEFDINDKYHKVSNGIAHFLEHVNFNIDDNITAEEKFKKLGSSINAFTTFDFTSYIVCSNSRIKDNLKLLLDYVYKSYFTDSLVEKEKGIIVEEVRMGKNNPYRNLYYAANESVYVNSKRRNLVVGEEEDVLAITKEELELVHKNFYNVDNSFLVVTGNFNTKDIIEVADNTKLEKNKNIVRIKEIEEIDRVNDKYKEIIDNKVEIPKLRMSYKINNKLYDDYDKEELEIYMNILLKNNFDETSLLYEELSEKELITYMVSDYSDEDGYLVLGITIETKYPDKIIDIIRKKMKELTISEEDLIRKKRVGISFLINSYDDIEHVNTDIADQLIRFNKVYDNIYDMYNNMNIVKMNDIIKRIDLSNESILIMKKDTK